MSAGLRFVLPALAAAVIGTIACGRGSSTSTTQPATAQPRGGMDGGMRGGQGMMEMCPMAVEGTRVTVDDTEGGVAMGFTTATGDVADLRARVRRMAEMHAGMHGEMKHDGMHGGKGGGMKGMIPSDVNVVDIEGGARLELRTRDPNQLAELRAHARMHAQQMASSGQCPMMGEHGSEHPHR